MDIIPIFSVGISKAKECSLLQIARQLFKDNQKLLEPGENGLHTTLQRYNSLQDTAKLNNQAAVNALKQTIKKNAIQFYASLGFDTEALDFEVVNLWLNEMRSGASHPVHSHYGFQISGCFYVDVPQGSNVIKFYSSLQKREHGDNPTKKFNEYNAEFFGTYPEEGDMFFWESLLLHAVPELNFEGVRRSIAYDLKVYKKIKAPQLQTGHKMNLQDYVAVYNINNPVLCEQIIQELEEDKWYKHSYNNVVANKQITYSDDLDISYQRKEVTDKLQNFLTQCANDYIINVAQNSFNLQQLSYARFNRYKVGTNMKMHCDHIHTLFDGEHKGVPILSLLALLNDDFEGGDFLMFDNKKVKLSVGDVIVFPSNFLYPHAVTTVTKGTRYSCVSWGY